MNTMQIKRDYIKKKLKCISLGSTDESVNYSVECVSQTIMSTVREQGSVLLCYAMLCHVSEAYYVLEATSSNQTYQWRYGGQE